MRIKYTIIGAGIVGLAIARAISDNLAAGESLLVVEKEESFGRGISSRNSEVIHSGIYYPNGSLKHRLCIRGRRLMYEYCATRNISCSKCGKMIIARDESEIDDLDRIYKQARLNGVENVIAIDKKKALELEPDVHVYRALYSAETGIIDSHGLMRSLANDICDKDGMIVYRSEVRSIELKGSEYHIQLHDETRFHTEYVINAAGLSAVHISEITGISAETMFPCKGTYFCYDGKHSCTHLLYPIPHKNLAGLGVHATLDLNGRLRLGPDVEYVSSVDDFHIDENKKDAFYNAACRLLKHIEYDRLHADSVGIRPKIQGPDDGEVKDFYIKDEGDSGYPGFINLLGIESPGLTSALAIGEYVYGMIRAT